MRRRSAAVLQIPMPSAIMSVKERAVSRMYRVAVCEDEKNLREDLCAQCAALLSGLQVEHTVTPYSSAEELEAAFSAGAEFSLLCLDILMDGKTGMKLAQELRERDDRTQHPVYHRFHGVSQGRLQRPPHPVPAQAGFPGRSGAGDQNGFAVISSAPHRNLPGGRQDLCPAGRGYPLR